MIDRDIKEPLNLCGMKIKCNNPINTGILQHISNQLSSDWFTAPCFSVLTGITIVWHHHVNRLGTSTTKRIYHN